MYLMNSSIGRASHSQEDLASWTHLPPEGPTWTQLSLIFFTGYVCAPARRSQWGRPIAIRAHETPENREACAVPTQPEHRSVSTFASCLRHPVEHSVSPFDEVRRWQNGRQLGKAERPESLINHLA